MLRLVVLLGLVFSLVTHLSAQSSFLVTYKPKYDIAMKQPTEQIKELISEIDKQQLSGNELSMAKVVSGSLYAKLADLEFLFWDKLAHVQKGVELMRTGMSELEGKSFADSDALVLHLIRGITSGYIPTTFQPRSVSLHELETAIVANGFTTLDKHTVSEAYALLSKGYKETGDAGKSDDFKARSTRIDSETYEAVMRR